MVVINLSACSPAFISAYAALDTGKVMRRDSWPAGQILRKQDDRIAVLREGSTIAPAWMGPSGDEMTASDWIAF